MKVRIAYQKLGKVRFLGHLDMARLWERGLRKARLPVAMSAGFTPRPKVSFGLALPTGAESLVELLDVTFDETFDSTVDARFDLRELPGVLSSALPPGVDVIDADAVSPTVWSLQEDVTATTWVMAVDAPELDLDERVAAVLESPEIWVERERKGERRRDDVRPGILDLRVVTFDEIGDELVDTTNTVLPESWIASVDGPSRRLVEATLTTSGRGVRPTEMAEVLRPGEDPWVTMPRVVRTHQWIGRDDAPRVSVRAGKDTSHERRPALSRESREPESREPQSREPQSREREQREHEPA